VSEAPAGERLGRTLGRSAAWSAVDVAVTRGGQFAQGVIVARLLAPSAFGVFAVALVVHAVVISTSELGVSVALIRDDADKVRRTAPTVLTIALATSLSLGLLMVVGAPWLATVLGSPEATGAIRVMALTLPLAGISAVPGAMLRRGFRMDRMFVANSANMVATAVAVISLSLAGWGAMALAWSWVIGQAMGTAIMLSYRPGRCWPGWAGDEARRLLSFGLPLAGSSLVAFAVLNVDYVVVSRVLGAEALGLYVLAFNISGWPQTVFGSVVRSVSLPGFSRLRRDGVDTAQAFPVALGVVTSLAAPVCLILGGLAGPLVVAVYGDQWSAAAAALTGLCVLGLTRIILELAADYFVSLGRTRLVFLAQLPYLAGLVVALVVGVNGAGIAGAGLAQAAVAIALMIPLYIVFLARAGVPPGAVVRALVPPAAWALGAAAVAHVVAARFTNPWLGCLAGGTAGLIAYALPSWPRLRAVVDARGVRRPATGATTAPATVSVVALDAAEPPVPAGEVA
jgi:O-antigen/teichoic acid export membrane protein